MNIDSNIDSNIDLNFDLNFDSNINTTIKRLHSEIYNIKYELSKTNLDLLYYKTKKSIRVIYMSDVLSNFNLTKRCCRS